MSLPVMPVCGTQTGRNLILCFDGTGEEFDKDITNIVRFFRMLKKGDPSRQMVYYQPGVGTGMKTSSANPFLKKFSLLVDAAFANGLPAHVRGGYEFLMNNYKEGDRISLFGYSRGAYTARALAGMLQKVGLLPAHNHEQIKFAYRNYKKDDEAGWEMSKGFKDAYSIDVKIDFASFLENFPLDERRAKFKANLWGRATESDENLAGKYGRHEQRHKPESHGWTQMMWNYISAGKNTDRCRADMSANLETTIHLNGRDCASPEERHHQTDVKEGLTEVWFAGGHCDIGGGAVPNDTPNDLARIPLRWMVRECILNNTGILFEPSKLREIGLNPLTLWPVDRIPSEPKLAGVNEEGFSQHEGRHVAKATSTKIINASSPGPGLSKPVPDEMVRLGTTEDEKDAVQPIHDRLSSNPLWWILELFSSKESYQRHDGTWRSLFSMNLGTPRVVHGQKRFPTYVHRSVLYRMQKMGYKPRAALLEKPAPVWVD
ncbi:putative protein YEL023C [Rhizoctonia solani AG-1 IB]|uniref:T6SS Phospholipase effector Tle1-like catalytic domain-containing protein n=1 Tax=Thanatephorus cucumeris (strain AG1-IB / isolate 7/3/14) TaxID=1108050 RepID=M5C7P9_THACB|nr:putative protein YEL023C [Rhizoctonia solani AG-1 IB]